MVCIFCGGTPVTHAHIFRKAWVRGRLIPSDDLLPHHIENESDPTSRREWLAAESGHAPKCVCAPCNAGWMNDLDHAGETLAQPMIDGERTIVSSSLDKTTLATWIALLTTLIDQIGTFALEPSHHQTLYRELRPPQGSLVWLGAVERTSDAEARGRPRSWGIDAPHAYFCTVRINDLAVQHFVPRSNWPTGRILEHDARFFTQLWPLSAGAVEWPPPSIIRADRLDDVADAFTS